MNHTSNTTDAVPVSNAIYLRRRSKIVLPIADGSESLSTPHLATLLKNIEALGFTFSQALMDACRGQSLEQVTAWYPTLIADLQRAKGAHREYKPMYPDFPAQVMTMDESDLYLNALVHYLTDGKLRPHTDKATRPLLDENVNLQVLDLGSAADFERLFGQITASNTSLSEQDKEDAVWFFTAYGADILRLLPDVIPQKENMAFVAGLLLKNAPEGANAAVLIGKYCRTATDVLRVAVSLSEGDVSLATATKFRSFKRAERRFLLALVDGQANATEDMLRWKDRWIRLGERLHPGEYARQYPHAAQSFHVLRNDVPFPTFSRQIETTLAHRDAPKAVAQLKTRAGDFARRLDHLLRLDTYPATQEAVIEAFSAVADSVSTPVLLQARQHFLTRDKMPPIRVFFPKGNLAKGYAVTNTLPPLSADVCRVVAQSCENALRARFAALSPLGKVYVDPALADYVMPFAARSASRSYRTLTRGTRLPLPEGCEVLRFFVWWKNGRERTDIDLSASLFDGEFNFKDTIAYYNLKNYGGCHSGDIVDAPNGASEFIDISLSKTREMGVRYIVMTLNSYSQQPYCDLPECFAGWMARQKAESGEIYEPKTVQDRLDLTANTRIALPLLIDLVENRVVWCDMALRRNPAYVNNVHGNLKGINVTLQALTHLNKPTLHELFTLHAQARGELIATPEGADTVFSVESGIPFRQEEIASGYLA